MALSCTGGRVERFVEGKLATQYSVTESRGHIRCNSETNPITALLLRLHYDAN